LVEETQDPGEPLRTPEHQVTNTLRHRTVRRNLPQLCTDNAKAASNPPAGSHEVDDTDSQRPLLSLHVSAAEGIEKKTA
jgi:hypothetical protein